MEQLQTLLKSLSIETRTEGDKHCRAGWIQTRCPFCSDGRTGSFHLGINPRYKTANCYRCGPHGLVETLHRLSGVSYFLLRKEVSENLWSHTQTKESTPTGSFTLPCGVDNLTRYHQQYLEGRGFKTRRLIEKWGIGGIGQTSSRNLSWRIFIPIHYKGKTVSWTTRSIKGTTALRYFSAPPEMESINHRKLLYGYDRAQHSCIIHEGPIDVWRTGYGAVATFGLSYTRAQVEKISRFSKRIICFDNQKEAQERALKLYETLFPFPGTSLIVSLDAKDAAEASDREIKSLRRLLYKWDR